MQFLVISKPLPARPSELGEAQQAFWAWLETLRADGLVVARWRKAGRGAAVVFEVEDHDMLHRLLNQWSEYVPATFDIHALLNSP